MCSSSTDSRQPGLLVELAFHRARAPFFPPHLTMLERSSHPFFTKADEEGDAAAAEMLFCEPQQQPFFPPSPVIVAPVATEPSPAAPALHELIAEVLSSSVGGGNGSSVANATATSDVCDGGVCGVNMLVCGIAGAGKTSCVKAAFHDDGFCNHHIHVETSLALEAGGDGELCTRGPHALHVVWYVVDATRGLLLPYEVALCRTVLCASAPLCILLNKSDVASDLQLMQLRAQIEALQLPRLLGVFPTIASKEGLYRVPSKCSVCGSDDLMLRRKAHAWSCVECNSAGSFARVDSGIRAVVAATRGALPSEELRAQFDVAQRVSTMQKQMPQHHGDQDQEAPTWPMKTRGASFSQTVDQAAGRTTGVPLFV